MEIDSSDLVDVVPRLGHERRKERKRLLRLTLHLKDLTDDEYARLARAVAMYKQSPKQVSNIEIIEAFIRQATLSTRYVVERSVSAIKKLYKNAPSKQTIQALRKQGMLEGTYIKERTQSTYTIFYDVEKLIKRLAKLEPEGWTKPLRARFGVTFDELYNEEKARPRSLSDKR